MLLKTFKYSIKETIKAACIIACVIPIAFTVIGLLSHIFFFTDGDGLGVLGVTAFSLSSIFIITILVVSFAPSVFTLYLLIATHRDFTTDRAYLTFTLPVKPRDLILGKSLAVIVQFLILTFAEILGIAILCLFIGLGMEENIFEFISSAVEFFQSLGELVVALTNSAWDVIYVIENIITFVQFVVLAVFATILIAVISGNNKKRLSISVVVTVGICYLASIFFTTITSEIINLIVSFEEVTTFTYQIFQIIEIVALALLTFGVYKFIENRINKGVNLD